MSGSLYNHLVLLPEHFIMAKSPIMIYLENDEKEKLRELAKGQGLCMSTYIRVLVMRAMQGVQHATA